MSNYDHIYDEAIYDDIQTFEVVLGGAHRHNSSMNYRISEKSIVSDLNSLNVPEDVKKEAARISMERKARKDSRRKMLVFWCVFHAYNNLEDPQDPKILANIVGISPEQIQKAIKLFDKDEEILIVSPLHFVKNHLISLTNDPNFSNENKEIINQHKDNIMEFAEKICDSDKEVLENFPQVLAAAIIQYYIFKNNLAINDKLYFNILTKLAGRSKITINKIVKELKILNF